MTAIVGREIKDEREEEEEMVEQILTHIHYWHNNPSVYTTNCPIKSPKQPITKMHVHTHTMYTFTQNMTFKRASDHDGHLILAIAKPFSKTVKSN